MHQPIFSCQRRVTYAECAIGNHVYYARYLEFLESARGEFFHHIGSSFLFWQQQNIAFPVADCQLSFKSPARYDDLLTIQLWLSRLQHVRFQFAYQILNQSGTLLLTASTTHACASLDEKLQPIPGDLKERLRPLPPSTPLHRLESPLSTPLSPSPHCHMGRRRES